MHDRIFIEQLRLPANIGVYDHEKLAPQDIVLDLTLSLNLNTAAHSDALEDTLDYAALTDRLAAHCIAQHVQLVEALAQQLAELCLMDRRVTTVELRLGKPHAIRAAASVGVHIIRHQTA